MRAHPIRVVTAVNDGADQASTDFGTSIGWIQVPNSSERLNACNAAAQKCLTKCEKSLVYSTSVNIGQG